MNVNFDPIDIDEDFEEHKSEDSQIIQNHIADFSDNRNKVGDKIIDPKKSQLFEDKKSYFQKELKNLLKKFKNDKTDEENKLISDQFINQYFQCEIPHDPENDPKKIHKLSNIDRMQDAETQTILNGKDAEKMENVECILTEMKQSQENFIQMDEKLLEQKEKMTSMMRVVKHQLQMVILQNQEMESQNEVIKKQIDTQAKFYSESFKKIKEKTQKAETLLQRQIFSQQMVENLINDLLDLAKMQNNSFQLTEDYFSLSNVVYEAFQMLLFSANQQGIQLKAEIDMAIHLNLIQSILGDKNRFLQIFLNFLSNSLKFTDKGGCITIKIEIISEQIIKKSEKESSQSLQSALQIQQYANSERNIFENQQKLSVEKLEEQFDQILKNTIKQDYLKKQSTQNESHQKCVQNIKQGQDRYLDIKISIIDTGVGISKEGLKKLFINFSKLDENSKRNLQGTGLGLSICKQIIEQMGGSVDVKSELGVGTEFIIDIKTKCKVQDVKFNEEQNPAFNKTSQKLVFIEKRKYQEELTSCIDKFLQNQNKKDMQQNENEISTFSNLNINQQSSKSICASQRRIRKGNTTGQLFLENKKNQTQKSNDLIDGLINQAKQINIKSKNLKEEKIESLKQKGTFEAFQEQEDMILQRAGRQNYKQLGSINVTSPISYIDEDKSKFDQMNAFSNIKLARLQILPKKDLKSIQEIPINLTPIKEKQESILEEDDNDVEEEDQTELSEHKRFKVLIANDEPMQLYILRVIFQMNNFDVVEAQNGHEAYEHAQDSLKDKENKTGQFNLIVLDLNMPISDGYEACKKISNLYNNNSNKIFRKDKSSKQEGLSQNPHTMIIACTSEIQDEALQKKIKDAGFEDVYEAPIKDATIKSIIIPELQKRQNDTIQDNQILKIIQESYQQSNVKQKMKKIKRTLSFKKQGFGFISPEQKKSLQKMEVIQKEDLISESSEESQSLSSSNSLQSQKNENNNIQENRQIYSSGQNFSFLNQNSCQQPQIDVQKPNFLQESLDNDNSSKIISHKTPFLPQCEQKIIPQEKVNLDELNQLSDQEVSLSESSAVESPEQNDLNAQKAQNQMQKATANLQRNYKLSFYNSPPSKEMNQYDKNKNVEEIKLQVLDRKIIQSNVSQSVDQIQEEEEKVSYQDMKDMVSSQQNPNSILDQQNQFSFGSRRKIQSLLQEGYQNIQSNEKKSSQSGGSSIHRIISDVSIKKENQYFDLSPILSQRDAEFVNDSHNESNILADRVKQEMNQYQDQDQ